MKNRMLGGKPLVTIHDEPKMADRDLARRLILRAASQGYGKRYGMRQLNQAVCRVRRFQLVKPSILEAAGFKAKEGRK